MRRNYHRKLLASIYNHAKNVGIIGMLEYPRIKSKRKRGKRRVPLPFRGKRAENCSHNVGKSLGEGLHGSYILEQTERRKDVKTERLKDVRCRRTYVLNKFTHHNWSKRLQMGEGQTGVPTVQVCWRHVMCAHHDNN